MKNHVRIGLLCCIWLLARGIWAMQIVCCNTSLHMDLMMMLTECTGLGCMGPLLMLTALAGLVFKP